MPARFRAIGDPHAAIDEKPQSLEPLLALAELHGEGDAPWPPHYRKAAGEPRRAPPSTLPRPKKPLIEVARADREAEAVAAAEAWKAKHPKAAVHLEPQDVLVDRMRGSSSLWYRVRINLGHVPARLRPESDRPASQGAARNVGPVDG